MTCVQSKKSDFLLFDDYFLNDIFVYGLILFGNLHIRLAFAIDHYFFISKNLRPWENGMDFSRAIYFLGRLYFLFTPCSDSQGLIIQRCLCVDGCIAESDSRALPLIRLICSKIYWLGVQIEQLLPFAVAKLFAGLVFAGIFLQFGHQTTNLNHALFAVFAELVESLRIV